MDDAARVRRGQLLRSRSLRLRHNPDSEVAWPTLAHIAGVEINGRYRTKLFRRAERSPIHRSLKNPRLLFAFAFPRLVHLGKGRTLFQ